MKKDTSVCFLSSTLLVVSFFYTVLLRPPLSPFVDVVVFDNFIFKSNLRDTLTEDGTNLDVNILHKNHV